MKMTIPKCSLIQDDVHYKSFSIQKICKKMFVFALYVTMY